MENQTTQQPKAKPGKIALALAILAALVVGYTYYQHKSLEADYKAVNAELIATKDTLRTHDSTAAVTIKVITVQHVRDSSIINAYDRAVTQIKAIVNGINKP